MTGRPTWAGLLLCALGVVAPLRGESVPAAATATNASQRAQFVSVPERFADLKRAPVLFPHDRHTAALTAEGCGACHAQENGAYVFSFPKEPIEGNSRDAFMNAVHDACLGCHQQRAKQKQSAGPVTCGECHSEENAYQVREYLPALPSEYDALQDPYHRQCLDCHRDEGKTGKHAAALDWKHFYVRERRRIETEWPAAVYDYVIHDKHTKALEKRCELCHFLPAAVKAALAAEGREPTGQDWLRQEEPGQSWKQRESAHQRCLRCHLDRQAKQEKSGPVACGDCHVERPRPREDLQVVAPPDYAGKERILIQAEKARMAGVPFDHKAHIAASRSCSDCHHRTLDSCAKCHTQTGSEEGGFITLAESYHAPDSTWSCVGCHAREQEKPDCAGCHQLRGRGLAGVTCAACHTGELASLDQAARAPDPKTLFPAGLPDRIEVGLLADAYEPCQVEHAKIATKLTEISNASKLATYFHRPETTVCAGCHHVAPVEKGKPVPGCASCHAARRMPTGNVPTLLGAYHQQCLGCHRAMGYPETAMPQNCTGCHAARAPGSPP